MYKDIFFWVETNDGKTTLIRQKRGVRQGDPASPLIYNIVIENLSRKLNSCAKTSLGFNHLLYADDLTVLAETPQHLRQLHNTVTRFRETTGIRINTEKCKLMASKSHGKGISRRIDDTTIRLKVNNRNIPLCKGKDSFKYLGNQVGMRNNSLYASFHELLNYTKRLLNNTANCCLHLYQKHHLIRTFNTPKWEYFIRLNGLGIYQADLLGRALREAIRKYLKLPAHTHRAFFHADRISGGLNIPEPWNWSCATQVKHVISLLNSDDNIIKQTIRNEITTLLKLRYHTECTQNKPHNEIITQFLNGELENQKKARTVDCMDPTAHAPKAFKTSNAKVICADGVFHIMITNSSNSNENFLIKHDAIIKKLKHYNQLQLASQWHSAGRQGKLMACTRNYVSNSWMNTGELHPSLYSFSIKARMDLLPTNNNKKFWNMTTNDRCSHCQQIEDIQHLLSFCPHYLPLRRERHDKILNRIAKTVRYNNRGENINVRINQAIPEMENDTLRPDIVVENTECKQITIIDLAIRNQYGEDCLTKARQAKIDKYKHIKTFYETKGYQVLLDAVVFGALGATDTNNTELFKKLNSPWNYIKKMHKFIINDILRAGYHIWRKRSTRP
ncbi:uncharacterized protein LOC111635480 [Centruroides sculpturatus]|uniref:uncharacterized protein LOC111635480 n=1 Tax=Centruroides sculpturatus TaxID=218467 RepID=UPI000C6DF25C|nr:uncharacterized protein LOC111635480 [Centruroides sculpturatus]